MCFRGLELIYLDYNATTPLRPEALAAWLGCAQRPGNASSVHGYGRAAKAKLEQARRSIAGVAGYKAAEVVFTSGGTEANNLALKGVAGASLLVSAVEHDSILKVVPDAPRLPVDVHGVIDLAAVEVALKGAAAPVLLSVQWVNNETGVIQPIAQLHELTRKYKAYLHVDAVQALGRVALEVQPDLLTLSAHKVGGPCGVGALLVKENVPLLKQLYGGGQEHGRRAGTENLAGICAFAAAAEAAMRELPAYQARASWRAAFEADLLKVPGAAIVGAGAPRVANTTCVVVPGLKTELLLIKLDLAGVAASAGSACSSGKVQASHVLTAMKESYKDMAVTRFSFGWGTTDSELKKAAEIWTAQVLSAIR